MQHNIGLRLKECLYEAKSADLLHRSSESAEVGSLESRRYLVASGVGHGFCAIVAQVLSQLGILGALDKQFG